MNWIVLTAASFFMGILTAIPIGATQIETAKRSISGNMKSALMLVLGAVASDMLYGFAALYGIAPFLQDRFVEAFFWFVGAVILIILGLFTMIYSDKVNTGGKSPILFGSRMSFLVGFSIDTANPSMIFWWLFCFEFLKNMGIVHTPDSYIKAIFIVAESIGIGAYLVLLAVLLKKTGKFVVKKYESSINKALGAMLIGISVYFIFKAVKVSYVGGF